MANRKKKKISRAGMRQNIGGTRTERNNDQAAPPTMTPTGEKGDGLMFVNNESGKARESEKGMRKAAEIKPGDARQKGEQVMNNNMPLPSQDSIFRMDAIALARDACPKLTHDEWQVVMNALNSHRNALMLGCIGQITDALFDTRMKVADATHMGAGTHPDWPNNIPYPDTDGSASALTRKYPAWTDTQWRAVSLLAQAFWHYGLQSDELPLASE